MTEKIMLLTLPLIRQYKLSPMILSFPLTTIRFSRITVKGMESLMLLMSMTVRLSRFIPVP